MKKKKKRDFRSFLFFFKKIEVRRKQRRMRSGNWHACRCRFLKCWSFKAGKEVPISGHQCFKTTRNTAPLRQHTHAQREKERERGTEGRTDGGREGGSVRERSRASLALWHCGNARQSRSSQLPCDATHTDAHTHTHTCTHTHTRLPRAYPFRIAAYCSAVPRP